ncbi:hypothetical protein GCK72_017014 [Caenorhabditis remanei]|uniref:Uncharacterized protein n=1 Tax=Caenorhabditis remanei TaxID=31234 RepID=A0A6A5G7C1_CAERE|nr:hypothetical protein GCK72_017014 [Caenorhabditis remanei]KAF1750464.1 hypothetical protein GCK72_017014 [Caenorhabditis remanei]
MSSDEKKSVSTALRNTLNYTAAIPVEGEVRRAAASFQEHPVEDMSETDIITIRKPDGTTETQTVINIEIDFVASC